MFPLVFTSVLILLLVVSSVLSAVACWRVGWSQRVGMMILAAILPYGAFLYDPPQGEFAFLTYMFAVALGCAALALGALIGVGLRLLPSQWGPPILAVCAIAVGGYELGRQYVPPSCAAGPLQVNIGGTSLNVPTEMQPILFDPSYNEYLSFGHDSQKHDYARLCRMTANAAEPVVARTVDLSPTVHLAQLQRTCADDTPPTWCTAFSAKAYDRVTRIDIASTTGQKSPHGFWDTERMSVMQQGDFVDGALCTLSVDGRANQCWAWKPIGPDAFRIMYVSKYFDDDEAQPVDQVLAGLSEVHQMLRTIIKK